MKWYKFINTATICLLATMVTACNDTNTTTTQTVPTESTVPSTPSAEELVSEPVEEIKPTNDNDKVVETKIGTYVGSVGTYPIHMTLEFSNNDIVGYYSYDSQNQNLDLTGFVNGDVIELYTTDGREKFVGKLEVGRIYGDWFYNNKTLSFTLNEKSLIKTQPNELFKQIGDLDFVFSNGMGDFETTLHVKEDGTFEGNYFRISKGSSNDNYPNGIMLHSSFNGYFLVKDKLDESTYVITLSPLQYDKPLGTEVIKNETRYIYSPPYGLTDDKEFILCFPGTPRSKLSEQILSWDVDYVYGDDTSTTLTKYVLYGKDTECAFFSTTEN